LRDYLLIVRAGDASLHPRWMAGDRNFDLMVSYYGRTPNQFNRGCEYYHAMPGPRWPAHDAIAKHHMDLLRRYRRVGFACDDLDATSRTWSSLFSYCDWYEIDLGQPAVEGHVVREITSPQPDSLLRYVSYVEVMAPVLSPRALEKLAPTFSESVSGWGLPFVWSQLLPYPEYKLAIVDAVRIVHTTPVREGTLRPTLDALGIDPEAEMKAVQARYGIERFWMGEHARLSISHDEE
jgi:hypothetical protein